MTATESFYAWLCANLARVFDEPELQHELSRRIKAIDADLHWEVGPHDAECTFFAFSPGLRRNKVELAEQLAQAAPVMPGWVFLSSKPRKRWRRTAKFEFDGAPCSYDYNAWRYYLTSFNDGQFFDVNLIPHGSEHRPREELEYAASLFAEFELGERMFMEFVDRTNIILPTESRHVDNPVEHLHDQLLDLISKHTRH